MQRVAALHTLYALYIGLYAKKEALHDVDVARAAMSSSAKKMMSGVNIHCIIQ